ncbi:hypothetical protein [Nocardia asiatica]|uniref:hypothetical protein n=1 Tax=Nocardia asiatica TaxID=209252 RepID=UPI003EDE7C70
MASTKFGHKTIMVPQGTGTKEAARTFQSSVKFDGVVVDAAVALAGYRFDFNNTDDSNRPMNIIMVDATVLGWGGDTVNFNVRCQYADRNFDDKYAGHVRVLVIAKVD